jgi:hypothetical protein
MLNRSWCVTYRLRAERQPVALAAGPQVSAYPQQELGDELLPIRYISWA